MLYLIKGEVQNKTYLYGWKEYWKEMCKWRQNHLQRTEGVNGTSGGWGRMCLFVDKNYFSLLLFIYNLRNSSRKIRIRWLPEGSAIDNVELSLRHSFSSKTVNYFLQNWKSRILRNQNSTFSLMHNFFQALPQPPPTFLCTNKPEAYCFQSSNLPICQWGIPVLQQRGSNEVTILCDVTSTCPLHMWLISADSLWENDKARFVRNLNPVSLTLREACPVRVWQL